MPSRSKCPPAPPPSTSRWITSRRPARTVRPARFRHRATGRHLLERRAALPEGRQGQRHPISPRRCACRKAGSSAPPSRRPVNPAASSNSSPSRWRRWWTRLSSPAPISAPWTSAPALNRRTSCTSSPTARPPWNSKPEDARHFARLVPETGALFGARHYRAYHFLLTLSDHVAHFGLEHHESSDNRLGEKYLIDADLLKVRGGPAPARDGPLLERQVSPARRPRHARFPATDERRAALGL